VAVQVHRDADLGVPKSEQDPLRRTAAMEDPIERARALGRILTEYRRS
jgi:hypothetical protein